MSYMAKLIILDVTKMIIKFGMNEMPLTTLDFSWRNSQKYQESAAVSIKRAICTIILYKKNIFKKKTPGNKRHLVSLKSRKFAVRPP